MRCGRLIFYTGPMFSGKTENLITTANKYLISGKRILMFKPKKDVRYADDAICSHKETAMPAISIEKAKDIYPIIANKPSKFYSGIFIDEVQFIQGIDVDFLRIITEDYKIDLYMSGLILDSFRKPFSYILDILPYAEIIYNKAVCTRCGSFDAVYTYRKILSNNSSILIGSSELYTSYCSTCYLEEENKRLKKV